jgi:hypothetical protein
LGKPIAYLRQLELEKPVLLEGLALFLAFQLSDELILYPSRVPAFHMSNRFLPKDPFTQESDAAFLGLSFWGVSFFFATCSPVFFSVGF